MLCCLIKNSGPTVPDIEANCWQSCWIIFRYHIFLSGIARAIFFLRHRAKLSNKRSIRENEWSVLKKMKTHVYEPYDQSPRLSLPVMPACPTRFPLGWRSFLGFKFYPWRWTTLIGPPSISVWNRINLYRRQLFFFSRLPRGPMWFYLLLSLQALYSIWLYRRAFIPNFLLRKRS